MSYTEDEDGWFKAGWVHINPDVKERLKRIEAKLDNVLELIGTPKEPSKKREKDVKKTVKTKGT